MFMMYRELSTPHVYELNVFNITCVYSKTPPNQTPLLSCPEGVCLNGLHCTSTCCLFLCFFFSSFKHSLSSSSQSPSSSSSSSPFIAIAIHHHPVIVKRQTYHKYATLPRINALKIAVPYNTE